MSGRAREIIAKTLRETHGTSESWQMQARWISEALTAAGYRLLGPDEPDPVTIERCAKVALGFYGQTDYDLEPEAAVAESVTAKGIAAAICALEPKQ